MYVYFSLQSLVENGEMILSDGRRIIPTSDPRVLTNSENLIPIHPNFRMIVLANRPGFPFLGNDFFGALGKISEGFVYCYLTYMLYLLICYYVTFHLINYKCFG